MNDQINALAANRAYVSALERQGAEGLAASPPAQQENPGGFLETVRTLALDAVADHKTAEELSYQAIRGQAELTDVIPALLNAESKLNIVVAFRDRIIAAYQEIARMPI